MKKKSSGKGKQKPGPKPNAKPKPKNLQFQTAAQFAKNKGTVTENISIGDSSKDELARIPMPAKIITSDDD